MSQETKKEITDLANSFAKADLEETTYTDLETNVEYDVIGLHLADIEFDVVWQVLELYVSIKGKDEYYLMSRNNGVDAPEGGEHPFGEDFEEQFLVDINIDIGHNWNLHDELEKEIKMSEFVIATDSRNGEESKLKMVIAIDSCNGEECEFEKWMNNNYPEITTSIENTLEGGLFDENGELVENENYWDQYCSQ